MKLVAFLNEKGGTGKTTLSVTTAAGLAIRGNRVVLVDADPQGNAGLALGLRKEPGLYNVLIREAEWEDELRLVNPNVYGYEVQGELYVLPSNIETRGIPTMNPNPLILRERADELDGWADFVVFDTSPTPSVLHTGIYLATDGILFPTNCAFFSLDGLAQSILHKENAQEHRDSEGLGKIKTLGIIPTMYRSGTVAHDVGIQQLTAQFKRLVWPCVPLRTVWEQAAWAGESIFRYAPEDDVCVEMNAMIDRILQGLEVGRAEAT